MPNQTMLPSGTHLVRSQSGELLASEPLVNLLVINRQDYRGWPKKRMDSSESQQIIVDLETEVAELLRSVDANSAHLIVMKVSKWGGNRKQALVEGASAADEFLMIDAIRKMTDKSKLKAGLNELSALPGIALVMATKIYRFCCPNEGAVVDQHASGFFKSLEIMDSNGVPRKCTHFKLGWKGRLETYSPNRKDHLINLNEFIDVYLPLVAQIANFLNERNVKYRCGATGMLNSWRPADVEMATYYWGAQKAGHPNSSQ